MLVRLSVCTCMWVSVCMCVRVCSYFEYLNLLSVSIIVNPGKLIFSFY